MELNVKEQTEKLQAELVDIQNQINQVEAQATKLTQIKSELLQRGLRKQGAMELLNSLNGDKPKEKD